MLSSDDAAVLWHVRAWLALAAVVVLHVADEAMTGFLDFYNPVVLRVRSRIPWFPMPTFTYGTWLAGLILLVAVLIALTPTIRRGGFVSRGLSWLLSIIMFMNGLGHLAGSIYFRRWLPGATSAPLLLVASVFLAHTTIRRRT